MCSLLHFNAECFVNNRDSKYLWISAIVYLKLPVDRWVQKYSTWNYQHGFPINIYIKSLRVRLICKMT